MAQDHKSLSLGFLTLATHYLGLVESIFEQTVSGGNPHMVAGDAPITDYDDQTKWSDFRIIFPTLFLFYHGIELMIKGIQLASAGEIKMIHTPSKLLQLLRSLKDVDVEIVEIVEKYLVIENLIQTPLGDWLRENKLDIDALYERLRYPTDRSNSQLTNDLQLKYREEEMIPFIEKIISDSNKLRRLFVAYSRSKESVVNR